MGFFEILLIAVVALLVVGPERMPEAIRSIALTAGRLKRFFNNAREEIEKHVGADDIRQQLHNEAVMAQLAKADAIIEEEKNSILGSHTAPPKNSPIKTDS
jgi:sec-independent protein translocase protein TatB